MANKHRKPYSHTHSYQFILYCIVCQNGLETSTGAHLTSVIKITIDAIVTTII
jgi:hypothetical protein